MRYVEDYKEEVQLSLRIMKKMRESLTDDCLNHYSSIYSGLHEYESEKVRMLYFESYHLEWLDRHWSDLTKSIQNKPRNDQRMLSAFFARYYAALVGDCAQTVGQNSTAAYQMLSAQKASIDELIEMSDDWSERSNQLEVNLKKHKAHFKRLIQEAKGKGVE